MRIGPGDDASTHFFGHYHARVIYFHWQRRKLITHRPVWFVRFDDLDGLSVPDEHDLGVTEPSSVEHVTPNQGAYCGRSTSQ